MDQDVLARPHQIEPLTMNVLQVWIASGSHASSDSACHGSSSRKRRMWRGPTWNIR